MYIRNHKAVPILVSACARLAAYLSNRNMLLSLARRRVSSAGALYETAGLESRQRRASSSLAASEILGSAPNLLRRLESPFILNTSESADARGRCEGRQKQWNMPPRLPACSLQMLTQARRQALVHCTIKAADVGFRKCSYRDILFPAQEVGLACLGRCLLGCLLPGWRN